MTYAQWDRSLETGDALVDDEHRAIYELVNQMYAHIAAGEEQEIVADSLDRIVEYARVHFAHEEALMTRTGYPDLQHHCALHREFSAETDRLALEELAGVSFSPLGLTEFLRDWLERHIAVEDRRIGDYLRATGQLTA